MIPEVPRANFYAPRGPRGPWAPWGPGAPWGPWAAWAPILPMFPHWEKLFFRKSTQKSKMSTLGVKTKVVRAEIPYKMMGMRARGDLYLTISRISIF